MGGTHITHAKNEKDIQNFVGKTEGEARLGRSSRRMKDNIKLNLKEIVCECVDWIDVSHNGVL